MSISNYCMYVNWLCWFKPSTSLKPTTSRSSEFVWECAKRWSGVLEAPSWSGVLKTPCWSVVYDFSVDVFCKLGIDK